MTTQFITDTDLETNVFYWLDHYTSHGENHYSDTSEERIVEIYYDKIVDRVLEDLPELQDDEIEDLTERINKII